MSDPVRVRFAPSPTGMMHLGGVRSALFNYLYARHTGGTFVLRFEDTDRERLVPEAFEQIEDSLAWLGISPDEGVKQGGPYAPYTQSERLSLYQEQAAKLVDSGDLYPCWCSPERLDGLRQAAQKAGQAFKYDRYCLTHPKTLEEPHVLRFKIPDKPTTVSWDDAVRGRQAWAIAELDDFVAIKSDGYPTYHFANVVDDHLMAITHVLRAEEWIPSTPKHLLLYLAFGWSAPVFAHLPQVLGPDKAKLSKRHGARSVLEYRDAGYLPDAVVNFLAALGWNDGTTQEIYSRAELTKAFTLERIQKSPAVFDAERLAWLNGVYIRQMPLKRLLEACEGFWGPEAANATSSYREAVLRLVQERLKFLAELPELTDFFFVAPQPDRELLTKTAEAKTAADYLQKSLAVVGATDFTHDELEAAFRGLAEELGVKTGVLFGLLRVAVTGKTAAPGLFDTMLVLGRDQIETRLKTAHASLQV